MNIQQLSSYLPYGLKAYCQGLFIDDYAEPTIPIVVEIVGVSTSFVEIHEIGRTVTEEYEITDVIPILFPLSSLTEKIKIGGKEFVPSSTLSINEGFVFDACIQNISATGEGVENMPFWAIQKLFEWKIDVFGLIDKGEAISVYDLDKNPYE